MTFTQLLDLPDLLPILLVTNSIELEVYHEGGTTPEISTFVTNEGPIISMPRFALTAGNKNGRVRYHPPIGDPSIWKTFSFAVVQGVKYPIVMTLGKPSSEAPITGYMDTTAASALGLASFGSVSSDPDPNPSVTTHAIYFDHNAQVLTVISNAESTYFYNHYLSVIVNGREYFHWVDFQGVSNGLSVFTTYWPLTNYSAAEGDTLVVEVVPYP